MIKNIQSREEYMGAVPATTPANSGTPTDATTQQGEDEVFPAADKQKKEPTIDEAMEMINNTADLFGDIFGAVGSTFGDAFKSLFDAIGNFFKSDGTHGTKTESADRSKFSEEDTEKIKNVFNNIPDFLLGAANISEDDINNAISEMEEKGVENYIRDNASYLGDMLPEGFVDDVINDLKNGNTDELYDKILGIVNEQIGINVSFMISKKLEASIKDALGMLSEKM